MDFITGFCVNIHVCISLYLGVELLGLLVTMFNLSRNCQNVFSSPFHPHGHVRLWHPTSLVVVALVTSFLWPLWWFLKGLIFLISDYLNMFSCAYWCSVFLGESSYSDSLLISLFFCWQSSLVILDPSPLSDIGLEIFSPILWVFQFLGSVFWNRIFLFWKYQFFFFFYIFILS